MKAKSTLLLIFIFLGNVLCCDPLVGPFWSSTDGYWDSIIGKTDQNGPGLVLYKDDSYSSLRHVFLSGESDWADNNMTTYFPYFKNQMVFMAPLVKTEEPVVVRVDANNGKLLSNLSITVHTSEPNYFLVILGCNNVIYSMYGDIFFSLVVNDASTGEWIWQTPFEGVVFSVVLSDDCKYLTFLLDPIYNNLNYSLVRLNAMTGSLVWETDLKFNRVNALSWDWLVYESDVANRIAVARYKPSGLAYSEYSFQLFAADSGMMTFEKLSETTGIALYYSPTVFSKDGTLAVFSPLQTYGIKIGGNEDVQIWSTGGIEGVASLAYFSNSSKTVLFSIWNFGNTKYIAQNTNDGSLVWESTWIENVATQFLEYGADLLVLTGKALYKVDFKKCPLP